ncbi:hypothetical protein L6452_07078 [Arctium lappa]|uniref:Uncharacterized protein n=1 Tax=Arctium lappa TaxID=4217 RepID=A0ACB9EL26_ARCLA|nr:hypothetical protein L6452_07078 [Arctium lappa]
MVIDKKGSLDPDHSRERKTELKSVFTTFDKNKNGFITKQELSDSLKNIGISTSEIDVLEMVQRIPFDGGAFGRISNGDGYVKRTHEEHS